ncbi:MAG: BrnT family toxin [Terracidiphilus sp.]
MDTANFDWDDANIGHIAEHDVKPEEAEEVILSDPLEMGYDKSTLGEDRWSYLGETLLGRILQVVVTLRAEKV